MKNNHETHEIHETCQGKAHPQISQIFTVEVHPGIYVICENLSNLWINLFVNKYRSVKELCTGVDKILRAERKFELFVLQNRADYRKIRV